MTDMTSGLLLPRARWLAAAALVLAGCSTDSTPPAAGKPRVTASRTASPATLEDERGRCGVIDVGSERYGIGFEPNEGRPGDTITASGTTFRGEDGRWARSRKIELWWHDRENMGVPGDDGSLLLATVRPGRACRLRTTAVVPGRPPGRYWLHALVYDRSGFGYFLPERFRLRS